MFGRQDSNDKDKDQNASPVQDSQNSSTNVVADNVSVSADAPTQPPVSDNTAKPFSFDDFSTPKSSVTLTPEADSNLSSTSPMTASPTTDVPALTTSDDTQNSSDNSGASSDDLLDVKRQALEQLTPLVDELDQSPEEKFRTTMMMIQASDNQALIKDAYEAAQKIADSKTKAQALLDIVNEINYFTHPHEDNDQD